MSAAIVAGLVRQSVIRCISRRNTHNEYYVQSLYLSTQRLVKKPKKPSETSPVLFTPDYFISKYEFSPQIASQVVSDSARMIKPENPDLVLSYLKECGFSNAHLERVVRRHPQLLSTSPEISVNPKLKIFRDLGLSSAEVIEVIARNPNILRYQPERIIHSLNVFKSLLGSNGNVIRLLKKWGLMLYSNPDDTILPNIQFLKQCGVQNDQINSLIYTYSHLFSMSQTNLRRCVHKVDEMGIEGTSRMFIHAVEAVSRMSDENLKLKLKTFQDLGVSQDDISRLFRMCPMAIAGSTHKIKEVIEVLLETGKYDMACIVKNPSSLTLSVEKRYKPRLEVLKALERKGLIDKWPGIAKLCALTNMKFFEKFVAPNINELGKDFIAKIGFTGEP